MADPITYVFLLTMWSAESPAAEIYVQDTGLTAAECTQSIESYDKADPMWELGSPSCEIDTGDWGPHPYDELIVCSTDACANPTILQACAYEDSDNCFWNAQERGNGRGNSFHVINGVVTFYGDDL